MSAQLSLKELLGRTGTDLPSWSLPAAAQAARARALELGLPGGGHEDWRYTRMKDLMQEQYHAGLVIDEVCEEQLRALTPEGVEMHRLVIVNGNIRWDLSRIEGLPDGVGVGSLIGMREQAGQGNEAAAALIKRLDTLSQPRARAMTALNGGLAGDGIGLWLPDGVALKQPLHILSLVTGGSETILVQPRLLVVAGQDSRATLVESEGGPDAVRYLSNAVSEFQLDDGSNVEHVRVQRDSSQGRRVSGLFARLGERSEFRSHTFTFGGMQVRNESRVDLAGSNSHAEVNGLILLRGEEHVDSHTWFEHREPDCTSSQLFKGVLDGSSTSIFTGRIHVHQKGQRTDAVQSGDALLLSDRARSVARPQLEIYADDVKCTHGSTVGNLDETGLFYMRSRGIPADLGRRILMHAFASGLLGRLGNSGLAAPLDRLITRTLAGS